MSLVQSVEEYVARLLARQAGEPEGSWEHYVEQAAEAIAAMRRATPEILANIVRNLGH